MHRSNPLALASGLLFLFGLGLLWYVSHDFPVSSKLVFSIGYCAVASLAGFWMWQHGQRLARIIEDIPTSRIASAPQGYVELLGQAREFADMSLVTGLSGTPCLWYRWQIARRGGEGHGNDLVATVISQTVYIPDEHEESQSCIGIQDSTGEAVIFPYGSEIIAAHRETWYEGDARFTEERIMPGDPLYVLGDFSTHTQSERPWDLVNEVASQLSIWQADKPSLLRRFDRNGNGVLDPDEWEMMHREAIRSAKQKQIKELATPIVHRVMAPDNGYHFLISSKPPQKLASHYRFWRTFGLGLFIGMGALGLWLAGLRLVI
ncbi:MAG: hypothetical protein Q8L39_13425 [Burkholderiales bacterium]|nr:hypothetical protein [Burkholderiales bacterium]